LPFTALIVSPLLYFSLLLFVTISNISFCHLMLLKSHCFLPFAYFPFNVLVDIFVALPKIPVASFGVSRRFPFDWFRTRVWRERGGGRGGVGRH